MNENQLNQLKNLQKFANGFNNYTTGSNITNATVTYSTTTSSWYLPTIQQPKLKLPTKPKIYPEDVPVPLDYYDPNGGGYEILTTRWDEDRPEWGMYDSKVLREHWPFLRAANVSNVSRVAASFYLLEAMKSKIVGPIMGKPTNNDDVIAAKADKLFTETVETWDEKFLGYCAAAIGGEIRHHKAVFRRILPRDRSFAWQVWGTIWHNQDQLETLDECIALFNDMGGGGNIGGKRWATAANILKQRLQGKLGPTEFMNKAIFVDRVFSLQHNTGSFLNKCSWGLHGLEYVLQCHANDNPNLRFLAKKSYVPTKRLFCELTGDTLLMNDYDYEHEEYEDES